MEQIKCPCPATREQKKKKKIIIKKYPNIVRKRLARVGILGKKREPGVGKLGWHGNFDMGLERKVISFKILYAGFLNLLEIATVY